MNGVAGLLQNSLMYADHVLLESYFPVVSADKRYLISSIARLNGNMSVRFSSFDIDFEYLRTEDSISSSLKSRIQNFCTDVRKKVVFEIFWISGEEYAFARHPQADIWYAVTDNILNFSPVRTDLEEILRTNPQPSLDDVVRFVGFSWWNRALPVFFLIFGTLSMFLFPVFYAGGHATIGSVFFVACSLLGGRLLLSFGQRGLSDAREKEREEVYRILNSWYKRQGWIEEALAVAK